MIEIGRYNTLKINRIVSPGAFLEDETGNEVLLPGKYIPHDKKIGDDIEVFVYADSEDRPIATTLRPHAQLNEFAVLKVRQVNQIGAFLDWGLEKDLLVPFRQQGMKMRSGGWYLVYIYLDELTNRLAASAKVQKYFELCEDQLQEGDTVELLIAEQTDLGLNVVVNNRFKGLIFQNQVFKDLMIGERSTGYVVKVRTDGKLDISLRKTGMDNLEEGAQRIIQELEENDGFLDLHDKSNPDEIQTVLQMSKKNFKKSVGILYKQKLIKLESDGIRLVEATS